MGEPKAVGDLTAGNSCGAGVPGSMWRTVSFLAAQASLTSWSEARMSTIRDVIMVRNTGCQNSRRIPRPINRNFSIEPPHVDPAILTRTGSGQYCAWPQISSLPRPRIKMVCQRFCVSISNSAPSCSFSKLSVYYSWMAARATPSAYVSSLRGQARQNDPVRAARCVIRHNHRTLARTR